jgi:serine/threonine protein kinase
VNTCPSCKAEVAADVLSCPSCNTPIDISFAPTAMQIEPPDVSSRKSSDSGSRRNSQLSSAISPGAHSIDGARFIPGSVIADRYRIRGLLGKGGMGEVYSADDLKLLQPVALKFLPDFLERDGAALARFHREARIARQISHPNVCRVFDIGEVDGQHFISMEYVDGEDLNSLLRRIGRLPSDKAIEIARQICAGLAVAHENGVLHRDLKPANVMLDGRGRARITDFGLAGIAEDIGREEVRAGTPAYMAPEQISGKEVTARSDIYSLGLVLYELFTGKRAFRGKTLDELIDQQTSQAPEPITSIVKDIDPLIEKVVSRCIEKDPERRPSSALQVAASLPGGDPLAAALAAGETPSPEMVAGAHVEGALRPAVALGLLTAIVAGIALTLVVTGRTRLHGMAPLEKSPEVLADRATTIAQRLGYTHQPRGSAFGFYVDRGYLHYLSENDSSASRWSNLEAGRPTVVGFWYRQSEQRLVPSDYWSVSANDPPFTEPGMVRLFLDTRGRLASFQAVPARSESVGQPRLETNWALVFNEAGLNIADFKPVEPQFTPPVYADTRLAWDGVFPEQPTIPLHIEADSCRGKPVHFNTMGPWDVAALSNPNAAPRFSAFQALLFGLVALSTIGSLVLAKRNLRLGKGDRRGAFRLSLYVLVINFLSWLLAANEIPRSLETDGFVPIAWAKPAGWALFCAVDVWLVYVALEPYLRQRWPHRIVAWNRLLAGRFRDPLVGRDILVGAAFSVLLVLITYFRLLITTFTGRPMEGLWEARFDDLLGFKRLLAGFLQGQLMAISLGLGVMFLVLLFYMAFKKEWIASLTMGAIITAVNALGNGPHMIPSLISGVLTAILLLFVLKRFGLLSYVVLEFFNQILPFYPFSANFNAWYSAGTEAALVMILGLVLYAFYISLGGQPILRRDAVGSVAG